MIIQTVYVCSRCKKEFHDRAHCQDHEEGSHILPDNWEMQKNAQYFTEGSKYPDFLTVKMQDGAIASYGQLSVERPEKKEALEAEDQNI